MFSNLIPLIVAITSVEMELFVYPFLMILSCCVVDRNPTIAETLRSGNVAVALVVASPTVTNSNTITAIIVRLVCNIVVRDMALVALKILQTRSRALSV